MAAMGTKPSAGETSASVGTALHCSHRPEAGSHGFSMRLWPRQADIDSSLRYETGASGLRQARVQRWYPELFPDHIDR